MSDLLTIDRTPGSPLLCIHLFVYEVIDNGVGCDSAYTDRLFGVFQRLHALHEYPGVGVGLAIVHRIVTRHGGQIWAKAQSKQGAVFGFLFPRSLKNPMAPMTPL